MSGSGDAAVPLVDAVRDQGQAGAVPSVLLVDDSPVIRLLVRRALAEFDVTEALDGPAGLAAALELCPDVVLLDRYLPGQDGLEVLSALMADDRTRDTPVIFLTADDDPATLVTALEVGAHDFVRKPFLAEELVARVRGAARLKRLGDELREVASHDPLTGLLNRRAMQQELRRWTSLHQRYDIPVSMLVGDLRGFKRINDAFGHAAGDQALVSVARALTATVRDGDAVGRWGGDEFVVLLPHTDLAGAQVLADRLVDIVCTTTIHVPGVDTSDARLGITIGIADNPCEPDGSDLVHRADLHLYGQRA
jgi:two-component system cell cycle response regulator